MYGSNRSVPDETHLAIARLHFPKRRPDLFVVHSVYELSPFSAGGHNILLLMEFHSPAGHTQELK